MVPMLHSGGEPPTVPDTLAELLTCNVPTDEHWLENMLLFALTPFREPKTLAAEVTHEADHVEMDRPPPKPLKPPPEWDKWITPIPVIWTMLHAPLQAPEGAASNPEHNLTVWYSHRFFNWSAGSISILSIPSYSSFYPSILSFLFALFIIICSLYTKNYSYLSHFFQ